MNNGNLSNIIRIFGVPMDLGQNRRGVDVGPSAVRYAGLQPRLERLGYEVHDGGNIEVAQVEQMHDVLPIQTSLKENEKAYYLSEVSHVCHMVYNRTVACVDAHERVIFLGGDHSISIGTVSGIVQDEPVGVLWVDAHADINSPQTSLSGNIHGMSVATLLGDGPTELTDIGRPGPKLQPEQVAMIGLRDLDPKEQDRLRKGGVGVFTMRQIDELGMAAVIHQTLQRFQQFKYLHVSLDLDGLDPEIAPGVGTPVPGGLSYREAHLLMEILADSGKVRSMDIVEVNPILDDRNRTAKIAVELAGSLFGQRIL
jgi:arginase